MMPKRLPPAPELRADYVQEGQFFAWPLAVSGECEPIHPDSARICALSPDTDGRVVWGATDGESCHVFAALFKGAAGGIVDLGILPGAVTVPFLVSLPTGHPLATGARSALALARLDTGWQLWRCQAPAPHDSVQEPGFGHAAPEPLASGAGAVCGLALLGEQAAIWTADHVLAIGPTGEATALLDLPAPPVCPPVLLGDAFWWLDADGTVPGLRLNGTPAPAEVQIPLQDASAILCAWGSTLLACAGGTLHDLDPEAGIATPLAQPPLPDVQCLAGLPDGHAYGVCGHGIGHVFRVDRSPAGCVALGAAATAVTHHRYGFEFVAAATSSDGVIFLGEHDRGGHLWAFYPPLRPVR